jgi:hypothetical protein
MRILNGAGHGVLAALACAAVFAAWASPAVSGVVFYNNNAAYQAALAVSGTKVSSFNFNSTPYDNYDTPAGYTIDGVNFVGNTGTPGYYWLNPTPAYYCCSDYNNPNETLQVPAISSAYYSISNGYTAITLPAGATAFSFDAYTVQAGDYSGSGNDTLNLNVSGNVGQTVTLPGSVTGFLGFISSSPVTNVSLYGSTPEDFIDLVDGTVSGAVPEPAAWAMMLLGLGLIGAGMRVARQKEGAAPGVA